MVDLIDVILEGFKDIINWLINLFMQGLRSGYEDLSEATFGTPTPETNGAFVFGEATNEPWSTLQGELLGGEIMLVSLLLLVMSVQGRHAIRIFNIGSTYEARKTRKTAWVGAFLIITWYWIGTLTLYLVDGFTLALLPSLSSVTQMMLSYLEDLLLNPGLSLLFALIGGLGIWALEALFYIRRVLLYVYLYGMPIAVALAYGNVPVLSNIASNFSKRFVPLAILPLPAAIVFKGYDLHTDKATLTIREQRPASYLSELTAVLQLVADKPVTHAGQTVTISAAAARELLDDPA
jgi:type IV secretion system protein TrbL